MPTCSTCFCTVRRGRRQCHQCVLEVNSYASADMVDVYECLACDSAICVMHASERQLQRQLCDACYDACYDMYDESELGYSDSDMLAATDDDDGNSEGSDIADEWYDHGDEMWPSQPPPSPPVTFLQHCLPVTELTPLTSTIHEKCSICLDDLLHHQVVTLPCIGNHMFHPNCITSWLRAGSAECPLCRTRVNVLITAATT